MPSRPRVFYKYYYYFLLESYIFLHLLVFHRGLSNNKSSQISRTLVSILAVFNNLVFWMISTYPVTSKVSSPFNNPSVTKSNYSFSSFSCRR